MDISSLFDQFIIRFGWFSLQRDEYINIGQSFINFSTPDAIFFGKYITYANDSAIYGNTETEGVYEMNFVDETKAAMMVDENTIKTKRRKKNVISQNDILGSSAPDC